MTQADYLIDLIQHKPAEFARLVRKPPINEINAWCRERVINGKCGRDCEKCTIEWLKMQREVKP